MGEAYPQNDEALFFPKLFSLQNWKRDILNMSSKETFKELSENFPHMSVGYAIMQINIPPPCLYHSKPY